MMEFTQGSPAALTTLLTEPDTVIISEGLSTYLGLGLNDEIELRGEGLDNPQRVRIVGVARRIPGFEIRRAR